jgi:DNA-binding transcriptional ArsR family regulator
LDKKALKVLASETRIDILKKLNTRHMTVSELSRALDLSKSTVYEHLTKLIDAGLIKKGEDYATNRIYYELTEKGVRILHPHETTKIILLLSSTIAAFIGGFIEVYRFVRTIFPKEVPPVRAIPELEHFFFGIILIIIGIYLFSRIRKKLKAKSKHNNCSVKTERFR